ncbi:MAG: N-acetylmannosamine-6-phosphate 2-epimerase [Blastocatellia bacterium]
MINSDLEKLRGKLIVSCQARAGSPLDNPYIISAFALTAEQNGAAGVRINTPDHIAATKARVSVPIIGIEKVVTDGSDVYITPTFAAARRVSMSGAGIIAIDGTQRPRPDGERLDFLIQRIQTELQKPVVADISTYDEGLYAVDCGAEIIATTLCGHTAESRGATSPAFDLLERLTMRLSQPVICEGGVVSPDHVRRAFDCGAFAVVVGAAITGAGSLTRQFAAARGQNG